MVRFYPAIIERGGAGFGVFFPDVPGCTSAGASVQEAAQNAEEALLAHIGLSLEYGDTLPMPSLLDDIETDADVDEAARILVRIDLPREPVHVDLFLPSDLVDRIDDLARSEGRTRSSIMIEAAQERVRARLGS